MYQIPPATGIRRQFFRWPACINTKQTPDCQPHATICLRLWYFTVKEKPDTPGKTSDWTANDRSARMEETKIIIYLNSRAILLMR
jgi:hypothetical protein